MASNLVSALWFGAALVGLAVSSDPTKASTYDITVTPRFGDVGGTGVVSVDGNGGFNVTRLDVTMANGVNFDFPVLDHASAVINSEGDLVDLRARDVIPGDASLVMHGLFAHFVEDHAPWENTFESIADPASNFPGVTTAIGSTPLAPTPLAATPLPTTWTMMLIGLAGFGFVGYRGMKKGSAPLTAA